MSLLQPVVMLVVDDSLADRQMVKAKLAGLPVAVTEADTLAGGVAQLGTGRFEACLLDLRLPDSEGPAATIKAARDACANTPLIVMSGLMETPRDYFAAGADYCLSKSVDSDTLLAAIIKAQIRRQQKAKHDEWVSELLARSQAVERRTERIWRTSELRPTDANA